MRLHFTVYLRRRGTELTKSCFSLGTQSPDAEDPDGNGASIFTQSGATGRKFEKTVEAGQIGINAPIPVPLPMFAWSGNKGSVLGGASLYGQRGLDFWTQLKVSFASCLVSLACSLD